MLTKLLFRTLPAHYPAGSAYAHFPFLVPTRIYQTMEARGMAGSYVWERPAGRVEPGRGSEFPRTKEGYERRVKEVTGIDGLSSSEVNLLSSDSVASRADNL
jgi:linoleate 10R-lipoxygenase